MCLCVCVCKRGCLRLNHRGYLIALYTMEGQGLPVLRQQSVHLAAELLTVLKQIPMLKSTCSSISDNRIIYFNSQNDAFHMTSYLWSFNPCFVWYSCFATAMETVSVYREKEAEILLYSLIFHKILNKQFNKCQSWVWKVGCFSTCSTVLNLIGVAQKDI